MVCLIPKKWISSYKGCARSCPIIVPWGESIPWTEILCCISERLPSLIFKWSRSILNFIQVMTTIIFVAAKRRCDLYKYRKSLDISKNPLQCNKQLCQLLNPRRSILITASKYPCAGPVEMKKKSWKQLHPYRLGCGKITYRVKIIWLAQKWDLYSHVNIGQSEMLAWVLSSICMCSF